MYKSFCCFASSPAFGIVSAPDVGHFKSVVVSHFCFNLHFPDNTDVEHIFTFLFDIAISSLVRCLLRSLAHFFFNIKLFFSTLFVFKGFIYLFLERGEGREKERERNINV